MNALLFFLFVTVAITLVAYFLSKTSSTKRSELARQKRAARAAKKRRAEQLATTGNNRLADRDAVWQARKRHLTLVSESADGVAGQRYFAYNEPAEQEYDGYSRADRHQVNPAKVKPEGTIDDIMLPIRPRPAKDQSSAAKDSR